MNNPFEVQTPENTTAEYAHSIFVNVFTDFNKVKTTGHAFLHGPRGTGKSMMFRYLEPDCQMLSTQKKLSEIEFFGVYIPIKNTDLTITELVRLDAESANVILNEHFMVMYIAAKTFSEIAQLGEQYIPQDQITVCQEFVKKTVERLRAAGLKAETQDINRLTSAANCFSYLRDIIDLQYSNVIQYLKRLSFSKELQPYSGPLCGYLDFLFPALSDLKQFSFMPKGPIYLLIDDADKLNHTQTTILNSWVSTRTGQVVSLKISTQLTYKTYLTANGGSIDTPHDYSEVNIATIYTSSKNKYLERVHEIVAVRLKLADINKSPEEFFPVDQHQEQQIDVIKADIKKEFDSSGRGFRSSDDVTRYARPAFIKSLFGPSKSGSTYSYAGFNQLVHISDAVIRYFLDQASQMYSEEESQTPGSPITRISPSIQNHVVFNQAKALLQNDFEKLLSMPKNDPEHLKNVQKLGNLVQALGGTFKAILLSDRSEQKVFSVAFSDAPDMEVQAVLRLGVIHGYFHESVIGNKDGTGRTKLYVLTRRLAPYFTLDVTGFAGYLFVTNANIKAAMHNPQHMLRHIKDKGVDQFFTDQQLEMIFPPDYQDD
jgi:hypothetical protein